MLLYFNQQLHDWKLSCFFFKQCEFANYLELEDKMNIQFHDKDTFYTLYE